MIARAILAEADGIPAPRVLLCRAARLTVWELEDLSAPYWRCYVPLERGGALRWQGAEHPLVPGSVALIAPRTAAAACLHRPFRKAYLHALWEPPSARCRPGVYLMPLPPTPAGRPPQRLLALPPPAFALTLHGVFAQALARLPAAAWEPRPAVSPAMAAVRDLLDQRCRRPPGNPALARLAGLHPHHLVRRFTAEVGCPPQAYAQARRCDLAAERLAASDEPIEAILADLGFHDRSHFTRCFRRHWGCPPAAYRRRQGG